MESGKGIVVWAVDPFDPETRLSAPSAQGLARLAHLAGYDLKPTFVLSLSPAELEKDPLSRAEEARLAIERLLEGYGVQALPAEVILEESGTRAGAVARLLEAVAAEGREIGWISLCSHGRSGFRRFVFGSFAERVLQESPWPVLFHVAKENPVLEQEKAPLILFPTDFSEPSRHAFSELLEKAAPCGFPILLLHEILDPLAIQAPSLAPVSLSQAFIERQLAEAKRIAQEWIQEGAKLGLPVTFLLKDGGAGGLSGKAILKVARESGATLVALSTSSGVVDQWLLGSAALELLRSRKIPVWILGPKAAAPGFPQRIPFSRFRKKAGA